MRRVFGLRFAVEGAAILGVAALVWYERLSRLAIVGAMGGIWLVIAVVEWWLGRRAEPVGDELEPDEEHEPELEPELALVHDGSGAEPEPLEAHEPAGEPEPQELEPVAVLPAWQMAPREWNVWDLERLAREGAGSDAGRDEERAFLLMYLRDFAGPDGLLPTNFDGLVRDSFGDLIAGSRR